MGIGTALGIGVSQGYQALEDAVQRRLAGENPLTPQSRSLVGAGLGGILGGGLGGLYGAISPGEDEVDFNGKRIKIPRSRLSGALRGIGMGGLLGGGFGATYSGIKGTQALLNRLKQENEELKNKIPTAAELGEATAKQ